MFKKRSKAISIVVAFIFCLSFMAPAFVTPDGAQASSTYEVLSAPNLTTSDKAIQDLGVIKVTLADTALCAYSRVTVSLPSDLKFGPKDDYRYVEISDKIPAKNSPITIVARGADVEKYEDELSKADFGNGAAQFKIKNNNNFDIVMSDSISKTGADKYFYIYFNGIDLNNTTGDIKVSFNAPSGSGFSSSNDLVIAKSTSSGSTTTSIKKVKDLTDKGGIIDSITVAEDAAGSFDFATNNKARFQLKILNKGFEWANSQNGTVTFGWGLTKEYTLGSDKDYVTYDVTGSNNEKLVITFTDTFKNELKALNKAEAKTNSNIGPCKITFNDLIIDVDDNKANSGDEVEVKIDGYEMDAATIVVGKYSDYEAKVVEGTTKTIAAGQNDKEIGEFYIEEGAAGSLLDKRTFKFILPSGVEWYDMGDYEVVSSGDIKLIKPDEPSGDNDEIAKWEIGTPSSNDAVKIKFKDMKVNIAPDFQGDLILKIEGSAGVEGEIKVAEVKPAATIEVDKVVNVTLGKANQKIGNITLVEGAVEGFMDDTKDKGALKEDKDNKDKKYRDSNDKGNKILLDLDNGYRFSKLPTVKVTEGDIDLDLEGVALRTTEAGVNDGCLEIEVKSQSKKTPAKIEISDIYVDAFRTAPEGAVSIEFAKGVSAVNETRWDSKSPGKAVVANCVTAAMGETIGNGQFVIGSNIYEMNGVKKVMDAAPYVKNDRTYVPVRYLGYVLGLTDDDIVWDQAAQKVTFTKGDNTVELVIGSTTITVNGEEQVMDVAPEISSDRTMLPARYVAEAFGFNVGWDAINQIVLISK